MGYDNNPGTNMVFLMWLEV